VSKTRLKNTKKLLPVPLIISNILTKSAFWALKVMRKLSFRSLSTETISLCALVI